MRWQRLVGLIVLNASLAAGLLAVAPSEPVRSDRGAYEWVAGHPLEAYCRKTLFCYRLLVPVVLDQIPMVPERRWRAYEWAANTTAGSILAVAASQMSPVSSVPLLATILVQTSYGFAFTAYDPYTADPAVFAITAFILLCWLRNWPLAVLPVVIVGVFAKETVALVASIAAFAAVLHRDRPHRDLWIVQAVVAGVVILGFHYWMDTYALWGSEGNPSSHLSSGSWFIVWWQNNQLARKGLLLFAPFGFAWLFAVAGWRFAPREWRFLAMATVLPILALAYVQTPERALGNAFFVVVPFAALFLSRVPPALALAAVVANGMLTARLGSSTEWLPPASVLLAVAAVLAVAVAIYARGRSYAAAHPA